MLKIGEAAKMCSVSNRTLRYWEDKGILNSVRTENGYRYYDDFNIKRIRQIVFLRRLEIPVSSIERLFLCGDMKTAKQILKEHLESLQSKTAAYEMIASLTSRLIGHIQPEKTPESFFECFEACIERSFYEQDAAFQTLLLQRGDGFMADSELNNVRIVKLPAMTVASFRAESTTPEDDCSVVFNKFVLEHALHMRDGYRQFGFNNPNPSDGNPVYGYEMWVTIPEDFDVPLPLEKKWFKGGLYASIPTSLSEIGHRWKLLYDWCKNSERYDVDTSVQWLEECSMDFELFISDAVGNGEKQLDLLEPIKTKNASNR